MSGSRIGMAAALVLAFLGAALAAYGQSATMTFFVTSAGSGKGADLGGIEGADKICQALAQAVGAGAKVWRAYLSTQPAGGAAGVNARDRIGKGPWQNAKGDVIAQSVDDLHGAAGTRSPSRRPSTRRARRSTDAAISPTATTC
jgi:hypothetical protein